MTPGIIYHIYKDQDPIKETDIYKLHEMEDQNIEFITKKALCPICNVTIKESKRMTTPVCKKCCKKENRKKYDKRLQQQTAAQKEEIKTTYGIKSNGNSIWL